MSALAGRTLPNTRAVWSGCHELEQPPSNNEHSDSLWKYDGCTIDAQLILGGAMASTADPQWVPGSTACPLWIHNGFTTNPIWNAVEAFRVRYACTVGP